MIGMTTRSSLLSRRTFTRQLFVAGGAGVALACATPTQARDGDAANAGTDAPAAAAATAGEQIVVIDHIAPRPDFVGKQPTQFSWTAAAGADHYAIGIMDEVDRVWWRDDDVKGTSVTVPDSIRLESGTYFWMVSGLKGGQMIADSGLAAFVVER